MVSSIRSIKEQKQAIIRQHIQSNNIKGSTQVLTTLASLAFLWWLALRSVEVSRWLTIGAILLISLVTVRAFALMHECGHSSLFRFQRLNAHSVFFWASYPACRSTY